MASDRGEPAGVFKVSVALAFGMEYLVPLLPGFMKRYPQIRIDWEFDNRQVDLVAEGSMPPLAAGSNSHRASWPARSRRRMSSPSHHPLT